MTKSGAISRREKRIPEKLMKTFLEDVVNATEEQCVGQSAYFFKRYPELFPYAEHDAEELSSLIWGQPEAKTNSIYRAETREIVHRAVVRALRDRLRSIWKARDQYIADWRIFLLQRDLHGKMGIPTSDQENVHSDDTGPLPPSREAPITQTLNWLRRKFPHLKTCANEECPTPHFIRAKGKQNFCSLDCGEKAQKEHKKKWWAEHGVEWRKDRTTVGRKAAKSRSKKLK